jgi:AcrR family transcriptional regulator
MRTPSSSDQGSTRTRVRPGARVGIRRGVSADQRARIVCATERLIRERGAESVIVGEICAAAGISRGTFYMAFENRRECLLAVFDRVSAQAGQAMAGAYRSESSWVDAVRGALIELLAFLEEEPGLARFLVVGSLAGDSALRARRVQALAVLAHGLESACPAPAAGSLPPPFGGQAVVGAVASILHGRLREEPVPSLRDMLGSLMGVIVLPYLDATAVRRELSRPSPASSASLASVAGHAQ